MSLTKKDLKLIHQGLTHLSFAGMVQKPTADQIMEYAMLRIRVETEIRSLAPALEKGEKVLEWRVPREQAPNLNNYAFMKTWQRTRIRRELDDMLITAKTLYKRAPLNMAKKRRWVRATRFSTKTIDESSIDVIGGKMPLDALVRAEILVDDTPEWCIREPHAEKTKPGNAHLFVEVFEVTTEGEDVPFPEDTDVPQVQRAKGFFTKHLKGE